MKTILIIVGIILALMVIDNIVNVETETDPVSEATPSADSPQSANNPTMAEELAEMEPTTENETKAGEDEAKQTTADRAACNRAIHHAENNLDLANAQTAATCYGYGAMLEAYYRGEDIYADGVWKGWAELEEMAANR